MFECKIQPETIFSFTYIILVPHDGQSNKPKHVVYREFTTFLSVFLDIKTVSSYNTAV